MVVLSIYVGYGRGEGQTGALTKALAVVSVLVPLRVP